MQLTGVISGSSRWAFLHGFAKFDRFRLQMEGNWDLYRYFLARRESLIGQALEKRALGEFLEDFHFDVDAKTTTMSPLLCACLSGGFAAGEDTAAAGGLEPSYSIEVNDAGGNYCFDCRPFFGESNTFTNGPQPLVTYEGNYYTSADVCAGLHTGCMVESRNTMK